jgi:hypothetical protein
MNGYGLVDDDDEVLVSLELIVIGLDDDVDDEVYVSVIVTKSVI